MRKWIYDIILDERLVGDQGDCEFDTKSEAQADADDFIISELEQEYCRPYKDFSVIIYSMEVMP